MSLVVKDRSKYCKTVLHASSIVAYFNYVVNVLQSTEFAMIASMARSLPTFRLD
jgi:hypothetical protein